MVRKYLKLIFNLILLEAKACVEAVLRAAATRQRPEEAVAEEQADAREVRAAAS